jgi:hypothetical protein
LRYTQLSTQPLDVALGRVAAQRQGNVTTQQLLELGLDKYAIRRRVVAGRLHREHNGVYSVGRRATTPLERASAAILACGPEAVLSHASAMTLWGYWNRWDEPFEVTVRADRRPTGIKVHRSTTLHWRDVTTQVGIRATTPARTIFDVSPRLDDKALKRKVNEALHSRWLGESHLVELIDRLQHLPPARRIAPLIGREGTPTRAGWEDDFPAYCAEHGLPIPVMGARIGGYIVDALFVAEKVIVELDSVEFHLDRIAFENDRERDAETLARGYRTVRITWERRHAQPRREARRLHKILAATQVAPRAA